MKSNRSDEWPRKIQVGREKVSVYRRSTPTGPSYRVPDYSTGKRRFLDFADKAEAIDNARRIARWLSERDVPGTSIRKEEAGAYASAVQSLAPYGVRLPADADATAHALKLTGSLSAVLQAVEAWTRDNRTVTRKPVAEVVKELIELMERRGKSRRHVDDLRSRLNRFAGSVNKTASRRVVPLCAAAAAWLKPYSGKRGLVWANPGRDSFYRAQ